MRRTTRPRARVPNAVSGGLALLDAHAGTTEQDGAYQHLRLMTTVTALTPA
jgi:hypothetical protein